MQKLARMQRLHCLQRGFHLDVRQLALSCNGRARYTSSSTSRSFTSVTISSVMSSPSHIENDSSSSAIPGMSDRGRSGVSPLAKLAGRFDDATLFAGVLGDAFALGVVFDLVGVGDFGGPAGFVGVALGVVVRDFPPFILGEVNMIDGLSASAAGASVFFWEASSRGVDMTRSRCVGGEGLPAVSDAAVPKTETETDVERAVRRDGAIDGLPCTGALV